MKKKISLKDWNYIGAHNAGAKWVRPFCVYTLEEVQRGTIKQEIKIGWLGYLLMFVPVHIFKVFWCLWDGGLKEFEIEGRYITHHYLYESDSPFCDYYKRAKEILEREGAQRSLFAFRRITSKSSENSSCIFGKYVILYWCQGERGTYLRPCVLPCGRVEHGVNDLSWPGSKKNVKNPLTISTRCAIMIKQ